MQEKQFKEGDLIVSDDSIGHDLYIILSGKVNVYKIINSQKVDLCQFGKGDFFGEMSLFLDAKRNANVEALENTTVQIVDKQSLLDKIKTQPELALKMLSEMAERIRDQHDLIAKIQGITRSYEIMYRKK